ncbi:uncharacterized protein LOC106053027 isoform X8 [Biomphalaria glabrata]|uniref:Uncharacterized protein LOC106053027 isoform X8 n=1 Tax=Biomphalaria glabrata TaxID=6526 RepID=A0A9W3A754_BIOGL|nr:uncharacterized protein LOC106053027 isoform X8 [Biomphalaria glabrata]
MVFTISLDPFNLNHASPASASIAGQQTVSSYSAPHVYFTTTSLATAAPPVSHHRTQRSQRQYQPGKLHVKISMNQWKLNYRDTDLTEIGET